MTLPTGGLRTRLIHESLLALARAILEGQGWFDAGRAHEPINIVPEAVPAHVTVPPNTLSIFFDTIDDDESECGSSATDDRYAVVIDFYAQPDVEGRPSIGEAVGTDVIGDIRAGLLGQLPDLGRTVPIVEVLDYRNPTPDYLFYVTVEHMRRDRAHDFREAWRRFWFSLSFDLVDEGAGNG